MTERTRVLYVDDDPDLLELTASRLERSDDGFEVLTEASAEAGLERIDETRIDCVVSDYPLPGLDGIEFLRRVRSTAPDLPFVLFTGDGSEAIASEATSAGVTDYLVRGQETAQCDTLASRVRDAAERRESRLELQRPGWDVTGTESHLRRALDALEAPFFLFDRGGFLREWNDAVPEVTGYEPDELARMSPLEFVPSEARGPATETLERIAETGHGTVTTDVETADGGRIPYELRISRLPDDGLTPEFVGVGSDVSERRRNEAALDRLHGVTRDLLRAETRTEVAELLTDAVDDVLGYPINIIRLLDESETRLPPVAVTRSARVKMGERPVYELGEGSAGDAFVRGETVAHDDIRERDDGFERGAVRATVVAPIEGHGTISVGDGEAGTFDDVEIQLLETLASNAAVALDRLDEIDRRRAETERLREFADVVSHDLRNPLATARGWLGQVRADTDDDRLRRVDDALDDAEAIVDDVLTLARTDEVTSRRPLRLERVVRDCWAVVDDGATLRVETDGTVEADEGLLSRLLENLFRNALEHGSTDDETGRDRGVVVTVGDLPDEPGFYVEDDGPGVPADLRETVFEPGYTRGSGTGFGLRIVERVAAVHGWSARMTEGETGGARVEVRT